MKKQAKIIAVVNQKGGTAKTTIVENLGIGLARQDKRDEMYFQCFINWQHKLEQDFALDSYETRAFSLNQLKQSLNRASRNINYENNINSLPYQKKPKWPMRIEKEVEIEARYFRNGWRPSRFVSGEEIRKGIDLQFVIRADHLRVYDIYWQVTNTGYEAERARQIRGDFYDSQIVEGKKARKESMSYSGEHFVEAYIVKDGICYGKSKLFCVKIH